MFTSRRLPTDMVMMMTCLQPEYICALLYNCSLSTVQCTIMILYFPRKTIKQFTTFLKHKDDSWEILHCLFRLLIITCFVFCIMCDYKIISQLSRVGWKAKWDILMYVSIDNVVWISRIDVEILTSGCPYKPQSLLGLLYHTQINSAVLKYS